MTETSVEIAAPAPDGKSRTRRLVEIGIWLAAIAIAIVILDLIGVDVTGWLHDLWDQIKAVPAGYIVAGLVFQTLPDGARRATPTTASSAPRTRAR